MLLFPFCFSSTQRWIQTYKRFTMCMLYSKVSHLVDPLSGALAEAGMNPGSNGIILFTCKANPALTLLFSTTTTTCSMKISPKNSQNFTHRFFAVQQSHCFHSPSTHHCHCSPKFLHRSNKLLRPQTLAEASVLPHHPHLLLQQLHLQETTLVSNYSPYPLLPP